MSPRYVAICVGETTARARLWREAAPRATARLLAALPIEGLLRHSRWSGETTYASFPELVDPSLQADGWSLPVEHPASIMAQGTLHYGPAKGNLGLPYGQSQSRAVGGGNTWGVHVATVEPEDLKPYLEALRAIRHKGAMKFSIRSLA
jgi:hypothetical protein